MSQSLSATAFNVRRMIGDTDLSHPVLDTPFTMYRTIMRVAQVMAAKAGVATSWVPDYFTSTAGSADDVQIANDTVFQSVLNIRDTTYGRILQRMSMADIDALREGITTTTPAQGIPQAYALWEDTGNTVKLRFDCIPIAATTYDVEYRLVPVTGYTDGTALDFSPTLIAGIEYGAAADLASRMPPDAVTKFGITPGTIRGWQANAADALNEEMKRQFRLKRAPIGVGAVLGM